MTDVNVKFKVPAIDKTIDFFRSYIVGPAFIKRKAKREAEAKLITAEGDAKVLAIRTKAELNAKNVIAMSDLDLIAKRSEIQEARRLSNIKSVLDQTTENLGDKEVPDVEPDHDWTARFFNNVQDISSKEMQLLWAKVLAEEVNKSGSVCMKTLDVLKNMDPVVAKIFQRLCSVSMYFYGRDNIMDYAIACSLGRNATHSGMNLYGLDFTMLNYLEEFELITSKYNTRIPYVYGEDVSPVPFKFENDFFVIVPGDNFVINTKAVLNIEGVVMTNSGRELSEIVEPINVNDYALGLNTFIESKHLKMKKFEQPED